MYCTSLHDHKCQTCGETTSKNIILSTMILKLTLLFIRFLYFPDPAAPGAEAEPRATPHDRAHSHPGMCVIEENDWVLLLIRNGVCMRRCAVMN